MAGTALQIFFAQKLRLPGDQLDTCYLSEGSGKKRRSKTAKFICLKLLELGFSNRRMYLCQIRWGKQVKYWWIVCRWLPPWTEFSPSSLHSGQSPSMQSWSKHSTTSTLEKSNFYSSDGRFFLLLDLDECSPTTQSQLSERSNNRQRRNMFRPTLGKG